jgi:hypothetical protein
MVTSWLQNPSVQAIIHVVILGCGVVIAFRGETMGTVLAAVGAALLFLDFLLYRRRRTLRRESLQDVDLTS